jgi:hypothetical protein
LKKTCPKNKIKKEALNAALLSKRTKTESQKAEVKKNCINSSKYAKIINGIRAEFQIHHCPVVKAPTQKSNTKNSKKNECLKRRTSTGQKAKKRFSSVLERFRKTLQKDQLRVTEYITK